MATLSKKAKLSTTKVGQRYETFYYFKQKVVNWEFIAPEGYQTPIFIDKAESVSINSFKDLEHQPYLPGSFEISKYVTEESVAAKKGYYVVTVTNTVPSLWIIDITKYIKLSNSFEVQQTSHLDSVTTSITFEKSYSFENSADFILCNEYWEAECVSTCILGPKYNAPIFSQSNPFTSFIQSTNVGQVDIVRVDSCKDLQHIYHVSRIVLPKATDNAYAYVDVSNKRDCAKDMQMLYTSVFLFMEPREKNENVSNVYSNYATTLTSKKAIAFIGFK